MDLTKEKKVEPKQVLMAYPLFASFVLPPGLGEREPKMQITVQGGMELRDRIAIDAMKVINREWIVPVGRYEEDTEEGGTKFIEDQKGSHEIMVENSILCYEIANSMLLAREITKQRLDGK